MNKGIILMETVRCALKSSCEFIIFAFVDTSKSHISDKQMLGLWVYTDPAAAGILTIEKILNVLELNIPKLNCELIILNHADLGTRQKVITKSCLYVRSGSEGIYWRYLESRGRRRRISQLIIDN